MFGKCIVWIAVEGITILTDKDTPDVGNKSEQMCETGMKALQQQVRRSVAAMSVEWTLLLAPEAVTTDPVSSIQASSGMKPGLMLWWIAWIMESIIPRTHLYDYADRSKGSLSPFMDPEMNHLLPTSRR
ncbi:hypothetical protein RvY_03319-2 [Ramazzottius varieornatus]|uniref:Uncharacterized protein n=1 Tax=Ramazzottius varieornatus TaxID=947166 RepID=A0A1D1UUP0_RAMVA|nr:hypothetical protein RvY_03319-2 [Ramazzottius varieornatus]